MVVKKNQEPIVNNDVQIIRQILFGEHIEKLSAKLDRLEKSVSDLKEALDKETKARLSEKEKEAGLFKMLHQDLKGELNAIQINLDEDLDKKVQNQRKAIDRVNRKVDRVIRQIRKDMTGHESQLENLVGSLASALTAYRPTEDENSD